jgi:septal ring factor EnvC (AmiA/AmiB activator)
MLRICLIVAIVAGLGIAGVSFFKVKQVMEQTMNERNEEKGAKEKEMAAHKKTKADLAKTKTELKSTQDELASTRTELKTATAKVAELDKNNQNLTTQLDKTKSELNVAQQTLEQWRILAVTPAQVKDLQVTLKNTQSARDTFIAENKVLNRKILELKNDLAKYEGDETVKLPAGLTGHILAVDPKFDFVVLDMGKDKGLLERGELLVNRSGRLVAKLKISDVRDHRAIANIMPGWQQSQLVEGDEVLTYQ